MKYRLVMFTVIGSVVLCFSYAQSAKATELYQIPDTLEITQQKTFVTDLRIDTQDQKINAIELELGYDTGRLELVDVSTGGSLFTLFPQAPVRSQGVVRLQAGVPGGFSGTGLIARFTWRSLGLGKSEIHILNTTKLFANDASGSAVPFTASAGTYTVVVPDQNLPIVNSEDHPDETKWYNRPFIRLSWETKPGVSYSYLLSHLPNEEPDNIPDQPVGDIKLETQEDGVFYFHLRECSEIGCGPMVTRLIQKDTIPPEPFVVEAGHDAAIYENKEFISFAAHDAASGIDHYEVRESGKTGQGEWKIAESPHILTDQSRCSTVEVRAIDRAGNERLAILSARPLSLAGVGWLFWVIIIVVAGGLFSLGYVFHRRSRQFTPSAPSDPAVKT